MQTEIDIKAMVAVGNEIAYAMLDDKITKMSLSELPQKNITFTGYSITTLDNIDRQERSILGNVDIDLDPTAASDQISGTISNLGVYDITYSGTLEARDVTVTRSNKVYSTTGSLAISGGFGATRAGVISIDSDGNPLQVYENDTLIGSVTTTSSGDVYLANVDSKATLFAGLSTNIVSTADDLNATGVETIIIAQ